MVQLEDTIYGQMRKTQREQEDTILHLKVENQWLKEQLGLAKKRLYAPSSEASSLGQEALLFNEAEACASPALPDPESETITYTRRKAAGKREMELEGLPVDEIRYALSEDEQICPQCDGRLHQMGEDVRNEIKIIPAQVKLVKHIRAKYSCRYCERNEIKTPILTAPMPETAFPGSLASPSAVAYIMSRKFVEGLPLYRQEQSMKRLGFEISRQTMANWMLTGAKWLKTIYDRMKVNLLERDTLHADETTLQVLHEVGRAAQTKSYMWLYRSGRDGPPNILYEYQTTRTGQHPEAFLKGYCGYLQVDGYAGYEGVPDVTLVGCWAHVRRKFDEAIHVLPAGDRNRPDTPARIGFTYCNRLFEIEKSLRGVTPEERLAGREARSRQVMDDFRIWLDEMSGKALPKVAVGEAVTYARNQWPKLIVCLEDGRLELDNNRAERAIKPFVIGRKNWLFANTPKGAKASATIYSIVETAKENEIDPLAYLTYLFERLPNINVKETEEVDELMPWSETVQKGFRIKSRASN